MEHPLLMDLANKEVAILGIDFQDDQVLAQDFLEKAGNPYQITVWDNTGKLGPTWGIYSIPQTFLINSEGRVLYHKSGRLNSDDIKNNIQPLLKNK